MSTEPIRAIDRLRINSLMRDAYENAFDRIESIRGDKYTEEQIARHLDRTWDLGDMYRDWIEEGD